MALIRPASIEAVREAADMVEIVGTRVQLRRVGARWTGRCPFHDERTPSFSVSPEKKTYHCFGCKAGGDVIRFVQEMEGLDFVGAVEWLADRYRIELEYEEGGRRDEGERRRRERLISLLEDASRFYERFLWEAAAGEPVRAYLAERGWEAHAMNLRGHFTSDVADLAETSMADYADDVAVAMRHLGRPAVLIGWGIGALVALMHAARRPPLGLVLLAPSPPAAALPRRPDEHELRAVPAVYDAAWWGWTGTREELRQRMPDLDDHDRPLNDRGRLEAPRIGRLLQDEKLLPDLVLSSTAERARATAQAVVEASSYEGTVRFHLELYLAPPSTYVDVLRSLDGDRERVLMIGHNPGIEDLVEILTSLPVHIGYIIIEHDMDVALRVVESVTMMHNGRIFKEGAPQEIEADPEVQELYLGGGHA